ncbi:MAG: endonuclease/exonuclease/phosphatase family protein [Rhodobacterales bacterium]|nr:endonuclease/exonuclease/phosphatase family protein [Rhodobacterales bacterium]
MTIRRIRHYTLMTFAAMLASPSVAEEPVTLRVMTFNVWYGGEQVDFNKVIAAIRAADADIVGLQEPDGNTIRIAAAAGYSYVDLRRHIISRYPLFDSGLGQRTETGQTVYSLAGLDGDAVQAWALVAPGKVVGVANLHLTSDPYGPNAVRDGEPLAAVLQVELDTRMPEIEPFAAALRPLVAAGVPLFVTGDFNSPSHLDWTEATVGLLPERLFPVAWPVSQVMTEAGFTDSYRVAHPDPLAVPGLTYSPGFPHPAMLEGEPMDRIDYVYAAHAETVSSEIVGEAGGPDVAISVTPWPSDHRAVVSTFTVTPMEAPALVAVEPRLVTEGAFFLVRVNSPERADWAVSIVPRGGDVANDVITGVEGIEAYWRSSVKFSTFGLAPGAYDAVMLDVEGKEIARTQFSVVAEGGDATVTVVTPEVKVGDPVTVRWAGAPGMRFDWIGIYRRGEPSVYNYLAFAYTGATLEGEIRLTPDLYYEELGPGDYEMRLMADDAYMTLAAAPFTITAP